MKKFFNTQLRNMTIGQSFLWTLLYMIFMVITMVAMMVVPQHAEEVWDWVEDKYNKLKNRFSKKVEEEVDLDEYDDYDVVRP